MAVFRSDYNNYLYQIFGTVLFQKEIHKNLGATINSINGSDLKLFKLPIPPQPEQQKISEILSTWDDAIAECKATIISLKDRNKGISQELLTGKKRLLGFSDKWIETTIEKITKNFSNKNKGLIEARIYSVTNSNGFVYQSDHFSREVAGDDLTGYKIIKKNEFAYNPARINVGSIAFFTDEIGIISSLYVCFKTNDKVSNEFFIEWLKIEKTKHDIERYGEGGVRIYLWYDLFKKLKINLPGIEEQNAIVDVLATANQELKSYQDKLEALQLQKKGLMQQLLTGKIRVNVK
jgi:type I restriction enzyme S subunit